MTTGIVILAAGESARMGTPKQLLNYREKTLLQHTVDTARALVGTPILVVLGAHAAQIRLRLDAPGVLVAENANWRDGMGGSVRTGLEALLAESPDLLSATFLLCDQPLLSTNTIRHLITTCERTGQVIVASEYNGVLGVPALFPRKFFPELLALDGKSGAQAIIHAHASEAIGVPFSEGAVDIDTRSDYEFLIEPNPLTAA